MAQDLVKTLGKRAPDGAWEIPILGDIGFFGVDGADLIRELNAVKPQTVKFLIYSPGGAVYDAIAVAGYIQDKGIECYAEIYGTCMSAATVFAALAGPKRTSIAAGSMFLVHMPYGGDTKAIDNAADYLVDLYVKSYGWTKSQARKHMEAEDGNGILWTADEAKELGVVGEVMKMSIAAHYKQKHTAMAEQKTKVPVKLNLKQAWASLTANGTEVEVDVEQATADVLAENATRIAQLETELEEAKAKNVDEVAQAEAVTNATKEATQAKADLATLTSKKDKELEDLKAAHEAEVKALKAPLAERTVADNPAAAIAVVPGAVVNENASFAAGVFAGMTEVEKAQHEARVKNMKKSAA